MKISSQGIWNGLVVETMQHVLPWMSNSVVGRMVVDLSYDHLCEEFINGGMNMIKVMF